MSEDLKRVNSIDANVKNLAIQQGDKNTQYNTFNEIITISVDVIKTKTLNKNSPYKGLKRFNLDDRDRFFGRDKLIARLLEAVNRSNLSLVLGASGSGKSSVVRAGLIPELKKSFESNKFYDFIFTPNEDPFQSVYWCLLSKEKDYNFKKLEAQIALKAEADTLTEMISTLKKDDQRWMIFIDQFEELFTSCQDLDKRNNFIESLVRIANSGDNSVKIILAMRADFLEQLSCYPALGAIVNENNLHLVTDMHPDELRQAIEHPAAKHGVVFEEGLVEQIIKEVEGQSGYLPLLQYTLDLLWQIECRTIAADGRSHIEDRTLNKANYNALEGVRGALQKRVNEIYNNLKQDEKLATKQIFAKLVNIVDTESGSKTVSRRANRSEFVGELVQNTLQTFIDENLLVSSSENLSAEKLQISDSKNSTQSAIIEIAHEILLSSWDRLKSWVEQEKEAIILKNWLAGETGRWQKIRSEDESKAREELLKGSRLEQVVDLREKDAFQNIGGLRAEENEFIDASVAEKDRTEREKREKEEQRQRELEAVQKLAKESEARAEQERKAQIATLSEKAATTRNFLSLNLEPLKGLVMAIEAIGTSQSLFNNILAQVESTLIEAINVSRQRNLIEVDQAVYSIAISADGQTLVSGGSDKKVRLWDKEGNLIREFQEHEEAVNSVAISADGHTIVSGSDDETVRLWDRKDDSIRILGTHRRSVKSVDISPDGQRILSGGLDAAAHLWTRDGKLLHIFQDSDWVLSVAISSDGQTVAIGGKEGSVKLLDRYGKPIGQPFIGHEGYERRGVNSVDISPDEQTIISGSYDGTIRFWDVSISKTFGKHQYEAKVAISSDGKTIVSADGNHSTGSNRDMESTIRLWDKESNLMEKPIKIFEASRFTSVTISPDGQTIFSGNGDGTLRLWNRNGRLLKQPSIKHKGAVQSVAFSPDGQYIVTGGSDNTVRLWDKEGNFIREFQGHQNTVYSVAFSLDGQYIVSGGGGGADNTVRLWDKEGNAIGQPFTGSEDAFTSVAFSPDGQTIVSSSAEGKIWLWNQQGKLIKSFRGHKNAVSSVAFSPDGQYIVSGGFDQAVRLWDREGNSLGQFRAQSRVFSLAFSPDGQYIVTSGSKTVQLWPFGWKSWLQVGCDRLRNNPVLVKPETEEAQAARQTCEKYAWSE